MSQENNRIDQPGTWVRDADVAMSRSQIGASLVAAVLLLIAGILTLRDFLPALGWAAIFAIALWPWYVRLIARWPRHARGLIPTAMVGAVLLAFVVPLLIIAVPLVEDAHAAAGWMQQAAQTGIPAPAFLTQLPFGDRLVPLWQQQLGQPGALQALAHRAARGDGSGMGRRIAAI